jgi:hypothetical protein
MAEKSFQFPQSNAILDLLNSAKQIQSSIQIPKDIYTQRGMALEDFFNDTKRLTAYEQAMKSGQIHTLTDTLNAQLNNTTPGTILPNQEPMIKDTTIGAPSLLGKIQLSIPEISAAFKLGMSSIFGVTRKNFQSFFPEDPPPSDTKAGKFAEIAGSMVSNAVTMYLLSPLVGATVTDKLWKATAGINAVNKTLARFLVQGTSSAIAWGIKGGSQEFFKQLWDGKYSPSDIGKEALDESLFGYVSALTNVSPSILKNAALSTAGFGVKSVITTLIRNGTITKNDVPQIATNMGIGLALSLMNGIRSADYWRDYENAEFAQRNMITKIKDQYPDLSDDEAKNVADLINKAYLFHATNPDNEELKNVYNALRATYLLERNVDYITSEDVGTPYAEANIKNPQEVLEDTLKRLSPNGLSYLKMIENFNSSGLPFAVQPETPAQEVVLTHEDQVKILEELDKQGISMPINLPKEVTKKVEQELEERGVNISTELINNLRNNGAPSNIVSSAVADVASKLIPPEYKKSTPEIKTENPTPEVNISKTQQTNTPKVKVQDVLKTIKNMEAELKDTEANVSQPVPIWKAIPEISNKFNITEEQAKQILLKLNDKNKIYIQKFEHPGYLPEEEQKYLIPSGNEYLGLISTKKPVVVEPITDKNVIRNQIMNDLKNKVINDDIGVIELNGYLKNHNFSQDVGRDVWKELTLTPEKIRTKIAELEKKAEELYKQKEPRDIQEAARKHAIETSIEQHIEGLKKTLAEYEKKGESRPEQLSKEYESLSKNIKTTPQYNQRFDLEASSQRVAGGIRNNQIINNVKAEPIETQNVAVEPSETQPQINDQDVINIVREFDSVFNYGNSVPTWEVIPEMMKKFKISKEEAEKVLLNLDDKEIIHLQRYDNPDILPDKLRQYLIPWQDTNFGFITVRGVLQPVAKSEATETKTVKTKKSKTNSEMPHIIHRKIPVEKYYTNEVKNRGGIRPYSDSEGNKYEIEEYLDGVPIFLRNKNGLPPDEMADELGFENEAQLYQALKAENEAKPETFDEVVASELRVGDKFQIDGEPYKVVRQTPEYTYLQDGELITVRNDETVQFDTGTFSRTQNSEQAPIKHRKQVKKEEKVQPVAETQPSEQNVAPNIKIEEPSKETIVVNASQEVSPEVKEKQKELLEKLERKARGLSELTERMGMDLQILYGDDPESAHWVREKYKLGKNNDKAIDKLDKMIYDKEQELKEIQGEITHLKDKLGEVLKERKGSLTIDKEELNSGLKRIADFLRKKVHPETTKEVQDFATFVEQWRIAINWGNYQAQQYADALRRIGNKRKYLEIVDSYLDNPEKYASEFEKLPEPYKEIARALKDGYKQMYEIARENGILDEVIENYTPHIYTDDPAEVYKLLFPKGGKLGRKFSFNYEREIPTEDEAIKLGLHPLKDPILKFQIYLGQMYKTIANIELYKQLTTTPSSYGLPLLSPEPKDNKELLSIWSKTYKAVNVPSFGMGSLRAHPEIANAINEIFAPYTSVHVLIHEYNVLSGAVKRALLINPLYHTWNLLTVFLNEVNFSPQALAKLFGNIPQDLEERAIKAGLEITKYSNSLREQLYNELKKTTLFDQVLSPFIWVEGQSDKLLWDKILPKFQLVAFAKLTEAVKKEHPDWTQERIDKTVADELNIAYGTVPKTWTNQLAQQYAPFFLLTYKWNVAVFDPLVRTLSGGGRGMGSGIFPEWEKKHLNKRFRGFVLKSLLAFFLISNLVQVTGLFVSNKLKQLGILKGRPQKVHFMFQNESGHKFDLDLGFRAADGSVDYIPLPLYKNVRDWIGMVMHPSKTVWNKLAPIPKVMFEEAANYSVWKQDKIVQGDENIWRSLGDRILYAVNQLLPSSYYTEQPGRVKTTAEWVLPILGMWMSKGTPGGDIEKLYYQYEAEQKQGKNDIDTQVSELLQRNKIRDAVMLMYQNGYSSQDISNRILKFKAPVTYFWLNISNPEKIKFLQFLQKHGKSTKDISNQIKSELEYANQGVP